MITAGQLQRAGAIIRAGGLVAFPTETVYGLGANALDAAAVDRIFAAKGRPSSSPVIVHVNAMAMAEALTGEWSELAAALTRKFWPGPLTLVVPKNAKVPGIVTAGLPNVGVRWPAHPVASALIAEAGLPIAAPSANRFTGVSPTSAEHVKASLGHAVELILDDGPTTIGIESTVLSLADPRAPLLLRPGHVSRAQIEEVIGPIAIGANPQTGAHASPGLHPRHYSPRTPVVIGDLRELECCAYVWRTHPRAAGKAVRLPENPIDYAAALYATLHELDTGSWELIVFEPVPETEDWSAVADRLRRAAGKAA